MNSLDRFIARSMPEPNSGCWFWMGALDKDGGGRVKVGGRKIGAHRIAYEAIIGAIPAGMVLDHKCRVRCCINPAHLEPVTNHENILRGAVATKPFCANGHSFSGENLFWERGARRCRECKRQYFRRYRGRRSIAKQDAS